MKREGHDHHSDCKRHGDWIILFSFETLCNLIIHAHIYTLWTFLVSVTCPEFSILFLPFLLFPLLNILQKKILRAYSDLWFLIFYVSINGIITIIAKSIFYVIVNFPDLAAFPILLLWFHFRIYYKFVFKKFTLISGFSFFMFQ